MRDCEDTWDSTRDTGRKARMTSLLTQHLEGEISSAIIAGKEKEPYMTSLCINNITIVF